jgi:hypothetical protein
MKGRYLSLVLFCALSAGCTGRAERSANSPSSDGSDDTEESPSSAQSSERSESSEESSSSSKVTETKDVPEPQFSDDMSVEDAIKAVPPGVERRNIDQETLGKPLQDLAVYEPCKPGGARVKLRVAVWNGKAVGLDVTTTPKNDKLAACIKERIRGLTWDAKVRSLNTIEYQL